MGAGGSKSKHKVADGRGSVPEGAHTATGDAKDDATREEGARKSAAGMEDGGRSQSTKEGRTEGTAGRGAEPKLSKSETGGQGAVLALAGPTGADGAGLGDGVQTFDMTREEVESPIKKTGERPAVDGSDTATGAEEGAVPTSPGPDLKSLAQSQSSISAIHKELSLQSPADDYQPTTHFTNDEPARERHELVAGDASAAWGSPTTKANRTENAAEPTNAGKSWEPDAVVLPMDRSPLGASPDTLARGQGKPTLEGGEELQRTALPPSEDKLQQPHRGMVLPVTGAQPFASVLDEEDLLLISDIEDELGLQDD